MKKIISLAVIAGALAFHNAIAMPNPWVDCGQDLICGEKKAGFSFSLSVENYTVRAMEDMFEITFPLDADRMVTVRKSELFDGEADENGIIDISGDYNVYPVNKTITLENGVKFKVRGEEDNYKVVNFAAETGNYSFTSDKGLHLSDIEHLYELLEKAEAPK